MKTTIAMQRTQKQKELTQKVCSMLRLTESDISRLMFETACAYMESLTGIAAVAGEFLKEPMFWAWWRQQWALIDEIFLSKAALVPEAPLDKLKTRYEQLHRQIDTFPDAVVWEKVHEGYMQMAQELLKKKNDGF
jgi:hypothetical protein